MWHLDANRAEVDVYNLGWKPYLLQRETDERRRKQERANTERKIDALSAQADKMRAKATKAKAAKSMDKRAERLAAGLDAVRVQDRVAKLRFPTPAPCGRTPLTAEGLSKSYGSLEVFTDVDLAVDRGTRVVVLGLNGAGKTTLLRILAGTELARHRRGAARPRAAHRLLRAGARDDRPRPQPARGHAVGGAGQHRHRAAADPRRLPVLRRRRRPAAGTLSGGEKTRLAMATLVVSGANVLLLDEPTNNLDPASREQVLNALRTYAGAIVLVTHDEGAVRALNPDKVILLPDGTEDSWSEDLADLVELA